MMAIITEETAPFFKGQKTAEETAKVIQNKVGTYLQE
jgi:multiple sugar transport system substrate-binding protein